MQRWVSNTFMNGPTTIKKTGELTATAGIRTKYVSQTDSTDLYFQKYGRG